MQCFQQEDYYGLATLLGYFTLKKKALKCLLSSMYFEKMKGLNDKKTENQP